MSNISRIPIWNHWITQSGTALAVAIIVPVIVDHAGWKLELKEQVVLGAAIWLAGMIFQIAHSVQSLHIEQLEFKYLLDATNDYDKVLFELQTSFRKMLSRDLGGRTNRVFVEYCRRSLNMSLSVVKGAAQQGELKVQDHHFETIETVMSAFEGCNDRTYRCVWRIEKKETLFDRYWEEYIKSLVQLSNKCSPNQRVEVSILFVSDDKEQLKRKSVQRVLQYVAQERRFKFRTMLYDEYEGRLRDSRLTSEYLDYGIYGDHLLFRTLSYEPNVGVFSDDKEIIGRYLKMHETVMTSLPEMDLMNAHQTPITLEEFIRSDDLDKHVHSHI